MKKNSFVLPLVFVLAIVIVASVPGFTLGVKYKTSGVYTDSAGGQHPWSVNDAHTLLWESEPYIPVGGAFCSKYLALGATDDNYQADIKALETIKVKGITDIILKSTGPITSVDPAALQKMIDYLDANGFNYGIEMNDGPKAPLEGYLISPNRYRIDGPTTDATITREWRDVDSGIYVVVNRYDSVIKTTGGVFVKDGKVTITLPEPLTSAQILIVYPHKEFKSITDGGMGDLWSGFSEYRDRVLTYFKAIKFGPGMRFFIEPFTSKMDFTGEMNGFIPDSSGFRLGFEAYLTQKYKHEGSVNSIWGLNDTIDSIETATRLIPMWTSGRGVAYAYDKASAKMYQIDSTVSQTWGDILNYRDTSAQGYMNTIADTLRKQVIDVPVIFKSSSYHRVFANPFGIGGFDGLGAQAYGTGDVPVTQTAGPVYSLSEECGKTTWYIVAATQTAAEKKTFVGYLDEDTMVSSLDSLREVGCKGFFVDSLQALPDDKRSNFSLLNSPGQLEWLNNFKSKLDKKSLIDYKPNVIYYPNTPVTGAYAKRLAVNTWWLPTLRTGRTSYIGDGLAAYSIAGEDRTYVWSNIGKTAVSIKPGPMGLPSVEYPEKTSLAKKKDGLFSMTLTDIPTVLRGIDLSLFFPYETANAEVARLSALIPEADKAGLDVKKARGSVDSAKSVMTNGQPLVAYGIAQSALHELLAGLGSEVWIEGEQPPVQNFGTIKAAPGASNSMALVLNTEEDAPLMPYTAAYTFDAPTNASYEIWLAATPLADASPVSYSMDDGWTTVAAVDAKADEYAPGLAWYKIGTINLFPGSHTIKLRADSKRTQDNRYYYAIDAIVLSPKGFIPKGVMKPF